MKSRAKRIELAWDGKGENTRRRSAVRHSWCVIELRRWLGAFDVAVDGASASSGCVDCCPTMARVG